MKKFHFFCIALALIIITAAAIIFCCQGTQSSPDRITMTGSVDDSGRPATESVSYDPGAVGESFGLGLTPPITRPNTPCTILRHAQKTNR